jgi:hypothetical protein
MFSDAGSLLEILHTNHECWKKVLEIHSARYPERSASINILADDALEIEVIQALGIEN